MKFGEGSLRTDEWYFLAEYLVQNDIKNVLEIGAGYSSVRMAELNLKVTSYETNKQWIEKIKQLNYKINFVEYAYPHFGDAKKFDFALVDGPAGSDRRDSFIFASKHADIIAVHDCGRQKDDVEAVLKNWSLVKQVSQLAIYKKNKSSKDCIVLASDENYIGYADRCIKSIQQNGFTGDIHLITHGCETSCHDVIVHKLTEKKPENISNNLFIKKIRFKKLRSIVETYETACLIDADQYVVNNEFFGLFDLVRNNKKLICSNERFKWTFGDTYLYNNKPIFSTPRKANHFHCSVPIIFNPQEWLDAIDYYVELSWSGIEMKSTGPQPIGDMFSWNIAVEKFDRAGDCILLPMSTLTQVHQTCVTPGTMLVERDGVLYDQQNRIVYTLHGRFDRDGWRKGNWAAFDRLPLADKYVDKYKKEAEHSLNLCDKWFQKYE